MNEQADQPASTLSDNCNAAPTSNFPSPRKSILTRVLQRIGIRRRDQLTPSNYFRIATTWLFVAAYALSLGPLMSVIDPSDFMSPIVYTGFGVVIGGLQLVSAFPLFTAMPPVIRIATSILAYETIVCMARLGGWLSRLVRDRDFTEGVIVLVCFPLGAVALQTVFWILRRYQWGVNRRRRRKSATSIKDLMIATTVIAFVCANAKLVASLEIELGLSTLQYSIVLAVAASVATLGFLFFFALLSRFNPPTSLPMMAIGSVLIFILLVAILQQFAPNLNRTTGLLFTFGGYCFVTTWFSLTLRSSGFRLYRQGRCLDNRQG